MLARTPCAIALAVAALLGTGCDAGSRVRVDTTVLWEGTEEPAALVSLQVFWFDLEEDEPFTGSVEARAAETAQKRWHRASYGISQKKWLTTASDAEGRAVFGLLTFYAGALFLPIHNLLHGAREWDPTGLWIVVRTGAGAEDPPQEFVVAEREGIPVPVRVDRSRDSVTPGEPAGSLEVGTPDDGFGSEWRLVLRLRPPEPR